MSDVEKKLDKVLDVLTSDREHNRKEFTKIFDDLEKDQEHSKNEFTKIFDALEEDREHNKKEFTKIFDTLEEDREHSRKEFETVNETLKFVVDNMVTKSEFDERLSGVYDRLDALKVDIRELRDDVEQLQEKYKNVKGVTIEIDTVLERVAALEVQVRQLQKTNTA